MTEHPTETEAPGAGAARLAQLLREARYAVALTGAGASTESGLPDFRSQQGLWRRFDPQRLASVDAFLHNPIAFHRFYAQRIRSLQGARPNRVHVALARLESAEYLRALITQNVDGLHQQAGSREVFEIHGNLRQAVCVACARIYDSSPLVRPVDDLRDLPRCACGGRLKPKVVLFGEALPQDVYACAADAAARCDLMLVVGTSLQVGPANLLPEIALSRGAALVIVNQDPTPLDRQARLVLRGQAGAILEAACRALGVWD